MEDDFNIKMNFVENISGEGVLYFWESDIVGNGFMKII